jgi:hypothetical protein
MISSNKYPEVPHGYRHPLQANAAIISPPDYYSLHQYNFQSINHQPPNRQSYVA